MKKKIAQIGGWKKILFAFIALIGAVAAISGVILYRQIFIPNLQFTAQQEQFIYIPTGSSFKDVVGILQQGNHLKNKNSFQWVSEHMGYTKKIRPGRYQAKNGMNNREIVTLLRSGKQAPVNVTFNNIRTIHDLCGKIGSQIEADSLSLINLLSNDTFNIKNGFNRDNSLVMFIPNTYEFYWNTSALQFYDRMKKEYTRFWTDAKIMQAKETGLTPVEVSILASIVEKETTKDDEKPIIAGVYLNRYKKGWKLEADPTLVYALGDYTVRRVLNEYKTIDSPYNTYLHTGLPPGPICLPSLASVNAVLNYSKHPYLFFCARDDFSGYHAFAKDYSTHLLNARRFQKELNRRNIRS